MKKGFNFETCRSKELFKQLKKHYKTGISSREEQVNVISNLKSMYSKEEFIYMKEIVEDTIKINEKVKDISLSGYISMLISYILGSLTIVASLFIAMGDFFKDSEKTVQENFEVFEDTIFDGVLDLLSYTLIPIIILAVIPTILEISTSLNTRRVYKMNLFYLRLIEGCLENEEQENIRKIAKINILRVKVYYKSNNNFASTI